MKKRLLSLVLALLMLLSLQPACLAAEAGEETGLSEIDAIILHKAGNLLKIAATDPETFGVDGIDYSDLALGRGIPTYMATDNGYTQTSVYYYPIYSGGTLFALVLANIEDAENISVGFTTTSASELDQFIENHSSLVILSGEYTAYAYSGGEYAAISEIPKNAVQAQNMTALDVEEVSADVIAPISLNAEMPYATLPPGYPSYSLMDIQIYTQEENSKYCWACCIVSAGHYETGSNSWAPKDLAADFYKNWEKGGPKITTYPAALRKYYNVYGYLAYDEAIKYPALKEKLNKRHPVICAFLLSNGNRHAIMAYGWYEYENLAENYVAYMDPLCSSAYIGSVNEYFNSLEYLSPYGNSGVLEGYVCHS